MMIRVVEMVMNCESRNNNKSKFNLNLEKLQYIDKYLNG